MSEELIASLNLDELDKSFATAKTRGNDECGFTWNIFNAYPSLSAKIRAADKLASVVEAFIEDGNNVFMKDLMSAIEEYEAIK